MTIYSPRWDDALAKYKADLSAMVPGSEAHTELCMKIKQLEFALTIRNPPPLVVPTIQ